MTPIAEAFFDGGSRGNPGPYGCATVIYHEGVGTQRVLYVGDSGTVNEAEYEGLLLTLRVARELGITRLQIRADSKLVVEQVLGSWRVKQPHLRPYVERARDLASRFASIEIKHVPREQNVIADALVTALLDRATGQARGGQRPRVLTSV